MRGCPQSAHEIEPVVSDVMWQSVRSCLHPVMRPTLILSVLLALSNCSTPATHAENTPVIAAGIAEINQELSRLRLVIVDGAPVLHHPTP